MDFRDSPDEATFRDDVRAFLKAEAPRRDNEVLPPPERQRRDSESRKEWAAKLSQRGWVAPAWPKEYGGAGLGVMEQFILNEEFAEARVQNVGGMGVAMIGPTLIAHGTEAQKKEHLSRILRGDVQWCQGYSEPGAGSDLAALQTRAVRDGDDWLINGQKIWTSGAHESDWIYMLARSDPDAPKHRGITYFMVDMKTPGITVRPLINMGNLHSFNEVFFEDVRVPAANIIGEVNRGWYAGTTTLDFERSSIGNAIGQRQTLEYYLRHARQQPSQKPEVRNEFADRWVEAHTAKMLSYRVITIQAAGGIPNHEASIAKLFNTELTQRISRTAMKMIGLEGLLTDPARAPLKARASASYLATVSSTIAGGTSEIQRNIVATRGLGLPRA